MAIDEDADDVVLEGLKGNGGQSDKRRPERQLSATTEELSKHSKGFNAFGFI